MSTPNPFHAATSEIYTPAAFTGRDAAYRHLNQKLADPNSPYAIVFTGRNYIGKSAFLWHFHQFFGEPFVAIYVPLSDSKLDSEDDLFRILISLLRSMLAERKLDIVPLPEMPEQDLREWFRDIYLPDILRRIRQKRIVFLIDDAEKLLLESIHIVPGFFAYWSQLLQQQPAVALVMTIHEDKVDAVDHFHPLVDVDAIFRLSPLQRPEVDALFDITDAFQLESSAKSTIYQMTGGEPLLSQAIAFELATANRTNMIESSYFLGIVPQIVSDHHDLFQEQWVAMSLNERLVLSAISNRRYQDPISPVTSDQIERWLVDTDYPLDTTTVRAALRGLEFKDVIYHDGDGVVIRVGMLQTWLLQYAQLNPDGSTPPGRIAVTSRQLWGFVTILVVFGLLIAALLFQVSPEAQEQIPQPTVTLAEPDR